MNKKSNFSVILPPFAFILGLCLNIAIALLVFFQAMYSEKPPHASMYVLFALLMLVFFYLMLMTKSFRVSVNGEGISVRTSIGRRYSFHISEIEKIEWSIIERGSLHMEKIMIKSSFGRKVTVESIMLGFDRMSAYIYQNVDSGKINISHTN